ncbi:Cupredoxin [Chiua virens]|nr:Cupredoxin [Chiua virens]
MVLAPMTYGASATTPDSQNWSESYPEVCLDLNSTMLVPTPAMNPPNSTSSYTVSMSFQQTFQSGGNQVLAYINNTSWESQTTDPTILQFYQGGAQTNFNASSQLVIVDDDIDVVDIIVNNYDDSSHPFHFHGHTFYILGEGDGVYQPGSSPLTLDNPPRRDTFTLPGYGYVIVRFINDNPGTLGVPLPHCMAHGCWAAFPGRKSAEPSAAVPDSFLLDGPVLRAVGWARHE